MKVSREEWEGEEDIYEREGDTHAVLVVTTLFIPYYFPFIIITSGLEHNINSPLLTTEPHGIS